MLQFNPYPVLDPEQYKRNRIDPTRDITNPIAQGLQGYQQGQQLQQQQKRQAMMDELLKKEQGQKDFVFNRQYGPGQMAPTNPGMSDTSSNPMSQALSPQPSGGMEMDQGFNPPVDFNQPQPTGQFEQPTPLFGQSQQPQGSSLVQEHLQQNPHFADIVSNFHNSGIPPGMSRADYEDQLKFQKTGLDTQNTQAEIGLRQAQTKKALAESVPGYKEQGKIEAQDVKRWDQIVKDTDPYKASSRSALGIATIGNQRANRAIPVLQNPNATNQDINTAIADISGIFQGGVPTESGIHEQEYNTLAKKIADMKTYITGAPSAPAVPEVKQHLLELVNTLKQINNSSIKDQLDYVETSHPDLISKNRDAWTKLRQRIGVDKQPSNPNQTPQISSQQEYDQLPSGTTYIWNGITHRKK